MLRMIATKEYSFFNKVKIKNKMRGQYYPAGRSRNTNSVWPCPSCLWNEPLCLLGAEGCCKAPSCAEGCRDRHTACRAAFHQLCFLAPSLKLSSCFVCGPCRKFSRTQTEVLLLWKLSYCRESRHKEGSKDRDVVWQQRHSLIPSASNLSVIFSSQVPTALELPIKIHFY